MSIIKCHECQHEVSTESAACQNCGAPPRRQQSHPSFIKIMGVVFAFLITIKACSDNSSPPQAQKKPVDPIAEARFKKVVGALLVIKSSLRDPGSFDLSDATSNDDASLICIEYRAKNGFGGTNFEHVLFNDKGTLRDAKSWNKYCTGRPLHDMKFARHALN